MTTKRVLRIKVETFRSQDWGNNELARATNIAPITISRLMRHLEAPSREAMERFAARFPDMEVTDLVEFVTVDLSAAVGVPSAKSPLPEQVSATKGKAKGKSKGKSKGKVAA